MAARTASWGSNILISRLKSLKCWLGSPCRRRARGFLSDCSNKGMSPLACASLRIRSRNSSSVKHNSVYAPSACLVLVIQDAAVERDQRPGGKATSHTTASLCFFRRSVFWERLCFIFLRLGIFCNLRFCRSSASNFFFNCEISVHR